MCSKVFYCSCIYVEKSSIKNDDFTKICLYRWNSLLVSWIGIKCAFLRSPYLASSSEKVYYTLPIQMNIKMIVGPIPIREFIPFGPINSMNSCNSWPKMWWFCNDKEETSFSTVRPSTVPRYSTKVNFQWKSGPEQLPCIETCVKMLILGSLYVIYCYISTFTLFIGLELALGCRFWEMYIVHWRRTIVISCQWYHMWRWV